MSRADNGKEDRDVEERQKKATGSWRGQFERERTTGEETVKQKESELSKEINVVQKLYFEFYY